MENKPKNKKMPDFDKLSDRVIAEPTASPSLVIKTNLDPKDATENNPYYKGDDEKEDQEFRQYFEEE
jgi:hypothetical protein